MEKTEGEHSNNRSNGVKAQAFTFQDSSRNIWLDYERCR